MSSWKVSLCSTSTLRPIFRLHRAVPCCGAPNPQYKLLKLVFCGAPIPRRHTAWSPLRVLRQASKTSTTPDTDISLLHFKICTWVETRHMHFFRMTSPLLHITVSFCFTLPRYAPASSGSIEIFSSPESCITPACD